MGKDLYKVKQLQNGKWVVVWPKEFAAPGASLIGP
jgi:branched-chain amino acid transport system substrate-binding protein